MALTKNQGMNKAKTLLVMSFILALCPWGLRIATIIIKGASISPYDSYGFISDVLLAGIAALIIGLGLSWRKGVGYTLLFLWLFVNFSVYEHVSVLNSFPSMENLHYLGDATFFTGSVLTISNILAFTGIILLSIVLFAVLQKLKLECVKYKTNYLIFIVPLIVVTFAPHDAELDKWRQHNFLTHYFYKTAKMELWSTKSPGEPIDASGIVREVYRPDLSGEPLISPSKRHPNILLVILESISSSYMSKIGPHCLTSNNIDMPELKKIANNNIFIPYFFAQQRQTNRGQYALLCGDLPKLRMDQPKMTEYDPRYDKPCLPGILRGAGYKTVYLQAAPLPFMFKDRFMALAGYDEVYGTDYFQSGYSVGPWGVDDRTLLEGSVALAKQLDNQKKPWFLTMLTSGTHHPSNIPKEFEDPNKGSFENSVGYLDKFLPTFITQLSDQKLLDNTLVIITSDESRGILKDEDNLKRKLSEFMSFMIVMDPEKHKMRITDPYQQSDLALSILDYLNMTDNSQQLIGRSIFRHYDSPRYLAFGSIYTRTIGILDRSNRIHLCSDDLSDCIAIEQNQSGCPTIKQTENIDSNFSVDQIHLLVEKSMQNNRKKKGGSEFNLVTENEFTVTDSRKPIVMGQFVLPENSISKVIMKLRVSPESSPVKFMLRSADVDAFAKSGGDQKYGLQTSFIIKPGNSLGLSFDYNTKSTVREFIVYGSARALTNNPAVFHVDKAIMTIHSMQNPESLSEGFLRR